jgi:hypothetical protein
LRLLIRPRRASSTKLAESLCAFHGGRCATDHTVEGVGKSVPAHVQRGSLTSFAVRTRRWNWPSEVEGCLIDQLRCWKALPTHGMWEVHAGAGSTSASAMQRSACSTNERMLKPNDPEALSRRPSPDHFFHPNWESSRAGEGVVIARRSRHTIPTSIWPALAGLTRAILGARPLLAAPAARLQADFAVRILTSSPLKETREPPYSGGEGVRESAIATS